MTRAAALYAVAARRPLAPDATLLTAWATARDGDAFAELVRRYGPLVWRVCRGVAGDTPAAEDAFQAAFLALSRRAGRVTAVAGFLHRTARRAAIRASRRDRRLSLPPPPPSVDPLDRLTARELLAAVDGEIARLPERQRLPVLLCGVDALTVEEAAARLGWSAGAVRGGLQRGRARLRERLAARGLAVPAVAGLGLVPERLTAAVLAGRASPAAARLLSGGWAMSGLKLAMVAVVVVGLTSAGGRPATDPPKPDAPDPGPLVLWEGKTDGAGSAVWHPDGRHVLAVGAFDGDPRKPQEVRAWDAATGTLVKSFPIPLPNLALLRWGNLLAVSPDGKTVAAGTWRGEGKTSNAVAVWSWDRPDAPVKLLPLASNPGAVLFKPDGSTLLAVTHGGRLSAFRPATEQKEWFGREIPVDPEFRGGLIGLTAALHPTADVLAVGQNNMRVSLWNAGSLLPLDVMAMDNLPPKPLAFSPDGRRLVLFTDTTPASGRLLTVHAFNAEVGGNQQLSVRKGARVRVPLPPRRPAEQNWGVESVGVHPAGRFVAAGFREGVVRVVDSVGGTLAGEWVVGDGPVWSAAFSPDGRRLLATVSGAVRVYEVAGKLAAGPVPDLRLTHERELDRFAGPWRVAAFRIDGEDKPGWDGGLGTRLVAVDPAACPKAADYRDEVGPTAGELAYAIYEFLDADTYRICFSLDADRRPTAFTAEKGSRQSLFTMKRGLPSPRR